MKISDFYTQEYNQSALYQSIRTIASYIDGNKIGARKIVHILDKENITHPIKCSSLAAKIVDIDKYIHGPVSLEGTIVTLAQDFPGANNYPLLDKGGNFGNKFKHEASASRYIYTKKSKWFEFFFKKEDYELLTEQIFEDSVVEPLFYMPTLPLILLNGSEGVGNGFAQKILPRKLEDITAAIKSIIKGKRVSRITPWVNGFSGKIELLDDNSVVIKGKIDIKNKTTIHISEIPFHYTLDKYIEILNSLVEKKIIKEYIDKSDNDIYSFTVSVTREFTSQSEDEILDSLKLVKRVTENFTCVDESNSIIEFGNEIEILKKFVPLRLDYYQKRKDALLAKMKNESTIAKNKIKFILEIIAGTLKINNRKQSEIEADLKTKKYHAVEGGFDYLLLMPIYSLTEERVKKLKEAVESLEAQISTLEKKTPQDLWDEDLAI